jgi:ribosomal protein L29
MATAHTAAEMRKMQVSDLQADIVSKRADIAKMKMGLGMRSEKDSAAFRRLKKELARLLTVFREQPSNSAPAAKKGAKSALKETAKTSTVPARRRSEKSEGASSL